MKLLLDQGLGLLTAFHLRSAGIDATHVGERGLAHATDAQIIDLAARENLVVVTLDSDFHSLLAVRGARFPSVVRIRIEGLKSQQAAELVRLVIIECGQDLASGAFVTVDERQMRVRRLPIGG